MTRRIRLALDVGLLVGFLVAFSPSVTGISIHEWVSLAIILPSLVHLIINWDWVMRVSAHLFSRIRAASKVNLIVDALLFGTAVTVMLSGLLISQVISAAIGVSATASGIWSAVHALSAYGTIALLAVHLGLHAPWIARTIRGIASVPGELAEMAS